MAVFSSTQNTAACAGGFKYSPMMSAAFCSKFGSLELMYRSKRCGCIRRLFHARVTIMCDTPSLAARRRVLQCVLPSVGGVRVALRIFC